MEAYGTDLVNLGNYFDTTFQNDAMTTTETQYSFYSKTRIIITEDSDLILKFDNSTEEKAKSKVKALTMLKGNGINTIQMSIFSESKVIVNRDAFFVRYLFSPNYSST